MAVRRSFAHIAASALLVPAGAGPLSPSAGADEPDPDAPEGTASLTVDILKSDGGADFEEPLAGQVVIAHWQQNTPMKFVTRTTANAKTYPDYVEFQPGVDGGCNSEVGRFRGRQVVNIQDSDACDAVELIHEIGHAVGLYHEQERLDRDQYVTVVFENIDPADKHNFQIQKGENTFGTAYDYASIMHYGMKSYSKNGKNTITPKKKLPAGLVLGETTVLSVGDIAAVKAMYK
ncbi:M12 family metallopeptidase [Kitasatospora sp. NPDC004531]